MLGTLGGRSVAEKSARDKDIGDPVLRIGFDSVFNQEAPESSTSGIGRFVGAVALVCVFALVLAVLFGFGRAADRAPARLHITVGEPLPLQLFRSPIVPALSGDPDLACIARSEEVGYGY